MWLGGRSVMWFGGCLVVWIDGIDLQLCGQRTVDGVGGGVA